MEQEKLSGLGDGKAQKRRECGEGQLTLKTLEKAKWNPATLEYICICVFICI